MKAHYQTQYQFHAVFPSLKKRRKKKEERNANVRVMYIFLVNSFFFVFYFSNSC